MIKEERKERPFLSIVVLVLIIDKDFDFDFNRAI